MPEPTAQTPEDFLQYAKDQRGKDPFRPAAEVYAPPAPVSTDPNGDFVNPVYDRILRDRRENDGNI